MRAWRSPRTTGCRLARVARQVALELGHVEFLVDFTVIDVDIDLAMLGLEHLRAFKCIVDLERDVLVFGGAGGVEVRLLPPERARNWQRFSRGANGAECTLM